MRFTLYAVTAVAVLSLWTSSAAFAQTSSAAVAESDASKLLQSGNAQAACDRLRPLLPTNGDDLQLHALMGQCLSQTGKPDEAISHYQFILSRDPSNTRARAELANAELAAGQTNSARADYQAVLDANPPPQVRADLQRILSSLTPAGAGKEWSAQATIGMLYDSNPGAGPAGGTITAFGTPFQISSAFTKHPDWGIQAAGELDYAHFFDDNVGVTAGVAVGGIHYFKYDQFDYGAITAFAGPAFRAHIGALPFQLNTNFNVSHSWFNQRDYSTSAGAAPLFTMPINDQLVFLEQASFEYNNYDRDGTRTGPAVFGVTSLQWFWNMSGGYIQPKLLLGHEDARNNINTDDQVGGSIAVFQPIGHGFSVYVEPGIRNVAYAQNNPAFASTRNDTIYSTSASLIYDLGYHDAQLALTYAWTFGDSNQRLYTYHRHQGSLQLTAPF